MIEVRLLGPLQVVTDGISLPLGTPKQQAVLAMLAVRPGRLVALEELIDELWPDNPPPSAVANTRSYAANLRRVFSGAESTRDLLVRRGSGYELRTRPDDVDLIRFVVECQQAREALAREDLSAAGGLLARAEARWRGPILAGVPRGPVLSARCDAIEEHRLSLVEQRAELFLVSGQPRSAIPLLRDHLRTHPLREHGHALLIQALYQDGDVSGALAAFTTARSALVEQLGIEPGHELQQLHKAVLNRDHSLERLEVCPVESALPSAGVAIASRDRSESATVVPRCWLPRPPVDFTGRDETVRRLVETVDQAEPAVPVVHVIDGMAGIGKTALAVYVATRLTARYSDAQLFIDLQGHSTASPVEPAAALVTLLRQLGVPAGRVPTELDHRIALWRAELAARRAIVLLDNAGSREQVEPLLPSAPGTLVLVTSRRRLLASDGISRESLLVLGQDDAVELLATVAGSDRIRAEPEAAALVVRRCGYLPLAIRLAGARLAHRPGWRVADLAQRLDLDAQALGEISAEDRSVASAFALSYEPLGQPVRRMFRLLGLYPGEFFRPTTVAALTGLELPEAESALAELVDHHLIEEPSAGRFRLHDLLRQYARELAISTEPPSARRIAIGQVLDLYVHGLALASESLELPHQRGQVRLERPLRPALLSVLTPNVEWLERERTNVRSLVHLAVEAGHPTYAWQLARLVWRFHYMRDYFDDIIETHRVGLTAATQIGDDAAIATMHNYIASAYVGKSYYREAIAHLEAAIELRRTIGDRVGKNASLANLAAVSFRLGRLQEAVDISRIAWREGQLGIAMNLGEFLTLLGQYEEALRFCRITLFNGIELNKSFLVAHALTHIGVVRLRLGQFDHAARLIKASLALRARISNWHGEAAATNDLGTAYRHLGRIDAAKQLHRRAIALAVTGGDRDVEAAAHNDLALAVSTLGDGAAAVEYHRRALDLATRISHPYEQGRALAAIGSHLESADPAEARRHWERALAIFRKMCVPERFEVERQMERLPTGGGQRPAEAGQGTAATDRVPVSGP